MPAHIAIRPIGPGDEAGVQQYASDARLAATCNVPHPYPPDGGKQFVERSIAAADAGERHVFAVTAYDKFAGLMTLNAVNPAGGTAELDYWIAVPFWGMGVGTAAARLAAEFAFRILGLTLLRSGCLTTNPASSRVLEKNGFVRSATLTNEGTYGAKHAGARIHRHQLRREDWEAALSEVRP